MVAAADDVGERGVPQYRSRAVQGTTTLRIGRTNVGPCHFPYVGDSGDRDRYVEHRPPDRGEWLLHGHVHDKWAQRAVA